MLTAVVSLVVGLALLCVVFLTMVRLSELSAIMARFEDGKPEMRPQ